VISKGATLCCSKLYSTLLRLEYWCMVSYPFNRSYTETDRIWGNTCWKTDTYERDNTFEFMPDFSSESLFQEYVHNRNAINIVSFHIVLTRMRHARSSKCTKVHILKWMNINALFLFKIKMSDTSSNFYHFSTVLA
jgi:hypothetical protein